MHRIIQANLLPCDYLKESKICLYGIKLVFHFSFRLVSKNNFYTNKI